MVHGVQVLFVVIIIFTGVNNVPGEPVDTVDIGKEHGCDSELVCHCLMAFAIGVQSATIVRLRDQEDDRLDERDKDTDGSYARGKFRIMRFRT